MKSFLKKLVPSFLKEMFSKAMRRRRRSRIKASGESLIAEDFIHALQEAGIQKGDVLLVHSSLGKFGNVEGGAQTIIEALKTVVGKEGTLVFPSFSLNGSMVDTLSDEGFVFDPENTPSRMGIISETFRKMPGVHRSLHPTHSMTAFGPHAAEIIGSENLEYPTNFGAGTPMGRIAMLNARIVGLGINLAPVTFYHSYEDYYPEKFPGVYLKDRMSARIKMKSGELKTVKVAVHDPVYHSTRIEKRPEIEKFIREFMDRTHRRKRSTAGPGEIWSIHVKDFFEGLEELYNMGATIYKIPGSPSPV